MAADQPSNPSAQGKSRTRFHVLDFKAQPKTVNRQDLHGVFSSEGLLGALEEPYRTDTDPRWGPWCIQAPRQHTTPPPVALLHRAKSRTCSEFSGYSCRTARDPRACRKQSRSQPCLSTGSPSSRPVPPGYKCPPPQNHPEDLPGWLLGLQRQLLRSTARSRGPAGI